MLMLMGGLLGVWMVTSGAIRRARRVVSREKRRQMLARTAAEVASLQLWMGLLGCGELLLEVPQARPAWWLVLPLSFGAVRLLGVSLWAELVRPEWDACGNERLPPLRALLRSAGLGLLWSWTTLAGLVALLTSDLSWSERTAVYAAFLVGSGLVGPALLRLTTTTRRPTRWEARLLSEACTAHGLPEVRARVVAGHGATAFVVGLVPRASRIYVSEALLEGLDREELAFVLAHEIAHRERWHLAWRTLVGLVTTCVLVVLGTAVLIWGRPVADAGDGGLLLGVLVLLPWVGSVVARAVGRSQERAADGCAGRVVGGAVGARSLLRLAQLNGSPLRQSWWVRLRLTHPQYATRIEQVATASIDRARVT